MKTIYSSGIAVAVTPFLGLPSTWKTLLLVILGLIIFTKGYSYYKKNKKEVKQLEASFKQNEQPTELSSREISFGKKKIIDETEETEETEEKTIYKNINEDGKE